MKHKWYKEIVWWAEGNPVQSRFMTLTEWGDWKDDDLPQWFTYERYEYRCKPIEWDESRIDIIGSNGNIGYEGFLDEL